MTYFHWITGSVLALIWLSRVVDTSLGVRTLTNISSAEWDRKPATSAGNPLIAINVRSTDRTGEIMNKVGSCSDGRPRPSASEAGAELDSGTTPSPQLKVVHIRELPPNWMGKAHAMWTAARQTDADWLLFTDADVMFRPDCLRRAIAY